MEHAGTPYKVLYGHCKDPRNVMRTLTSVFPIRMVCVSESQPVLRVEAVNSWSLTRLKKVVFPTPCSPKRMILYSGRGRRNAMFTPSWYSLFKLFTQPHPHASVHMHNLARGSAWYTSEITLQTSPNHQLHGDFPYTPPPTVNDINSCRCQSVNMHGKHFFFLLYTNMYFRAVARLRLISPRGMAAVLQVTSNWLKKKPVGVPITTVNFMYFHTDVHMKLSNTSLHKTMNTLLPTSDKNGNTHAFLHTNITYSNS